MSDIQHEIDGIFYRIYRTNWCMEYPAKVDGILGMTIRCAVAIGTRYLACDCMDFAGILRLVRLVI